MAKDRKRIHEASTEYEDVYLHEYRIVTEAWAHLKDYFRHQNEERLHKAFGYRTPHEVYFGTPMGLTPACEAVV
jgi:hypothetical protein